MKCPNKECGESNVAVYTRLLCSTGIHMDEGELITDVTETREEWTDTEPEYVMCRACGHKGEPEAFGLYSGTFLRSKLGRIIFEAIEKDGLVALPEQIMSLVLPQGGVLIHKGGNVNET